MSNRRYTQTVFHLSIVAVIVALQPSLPEFKRMPASPPAGPLSLHAAVASRVLLYLGRTVGAGVPTLGKSLPLGNWEGAYYVCMAV